MNHNTEHQPKTGIETPSTHETRAAVFPEKKESKIGRKGQMAIVGGIASALFAGGLGAGALFNNNENKAPELAPEPSAEAPVVPGEQPPEEVIVPEEAEDYVTSYANIFPDALATYYSEEAYIEANPGPALVLDPEYVDSYDFDTLPGTTGMVSPLGFSIETMPSDQAVNLENSIALFNDSIPNMDRLVNMLAKNPGAASLDVIKHDFSIYTGLTNTEADALTDLLIGVTREYGSNSFYSISPAVEKGSEAETPTSSVVTNEKPGIDAVDENGNVTSFSLGLDIVINVETFDDEGESTLGTKKIEEAQFTVDFAKGYDPNNNGVVGIGYR